MWDLVNWWERCSVFFQMVASLPTQQISKVFVDIFSTSKSYIIHQVAASNASTLNLARSDEWLTKKQIAFVQYPSLTVAPDSAYLDPHCGSYMCNIHFSFHLFFYVYVRYELHHNVVFSIGTKSVFVPYLIYDSKNASGTIYLSLNVFCDDL